MEKTAEKKKTTRSSVSLSVILYYCKTIRRPRRISDVGASTGFPLYAANITVLLGKMKIYIYSCEIMSFHGPNVTDRYAVFAIIIFGVKILYRRKYRVAVSKSIIMLFSTWWPRKNVRTESTTRLRMRSA